MGLIVSAVLIFLALCCGGGSNSSNISSGSGKNLWKDMEAENIVYDENGNEHLVDDDDYCDDCDDYHEDWY